jgi:predicted RNase H-like HicB family nuclease
MKGHEISPIAEVVAIAFGALVYWLAGKIPGSYQGDTSPKFKLGHHRADSAVDPVAQFVYSTFRMIVPLSKIQVRRDTNGVWIAKSKLLPGCHAQGRDRGESILRFQEAAKVHLEALLETGRPIPPAFRDRFVLTV